MLLRFRPLASLAPFLLLAALKMAASHEQNPIDEFMAHDHQEQGHQVQQQHSEQHQEQQQHFQQQAQQEQQHQQQAQQEQQHQQEQHQQQVQQEQQEHQQHFEGQVQQQQHLEQQVHHQEPPQQQHVEEQMHHQLPEEQNHQQQDFDGDTLLDEHLAEMPHLDPRNMSPTEKQYHLFLAHDYNQDLHLDGVEIMQSIFHDDSSDLYTDEVLAQKIDYLLDNFDRDRDGKLSFPEFMMSDARFTAV
ncbi:putative cyclin-dependent serine/threonine-protein kinase DDB_G0272797/DDB_G0274007 [Penaeus monodon]|uniref:putative cyclin-dependent serine/threonine-protein kinase DDB_G0272797/DDB_G0274007 n=1 Tax=Penaeus monodon TaxID=6687 RepID=UPI0018A75020|nr:putative cyclin-dependent serine/threonine-protein kinase DDB_G0272797/DDB_G0274007 [Penaeus monodon]XP_037776108.1 putative cyclin-dependent serine/threonine-protein kinase DDB_G0272797/DDB_G0274007 [Penaeus monodon]